MHIHNTGTVGIILKSRSILQRVLIYSQLLRQASVKRDRYGDWGARHASWSMVIGQLKSYLKGALQWDGIIYRTELGKPFRRK